MVNLCLVVIATQFSETKKRETERMWAERQRCSSSATLASVEQLGSCYDEILRYVAHLGRVFRRRVLALWRRYVCPRRIRRRRGRRRQQNVEEDVGNVEAVAAGLAEEEQAHDKANTSPRRLLRFDDHSISESTHHCHPHVDRSNGFPRSIIVENSKTTDAAPAINGQLTSDCTARVKDKLDANESTCFCSATHRGAFRFFIYKSRFNVVYRVYYTSNASIYTL